MKTQLQSGQQKLGWVTNHMPILSLLEEQFRKDQPFAGLTIAMCIHLEAKTARLAEVIKCGGATVLLAGSNPLSTQDDVALAIADRGVRVFAKHGCNEMEYFNFIDQMLTCKPQIILDDGGDVVERLHSHYSDLIPQIIGGCEETTTGVMRLKARDKAGKLGIPMISVNDATCKYLFDNRYGTGQSVWTAIMQTTNLIIAGKTVVVAGYGWCGKGVALRAKALGAKVIITEIDAIKAMEAHMDGFTVLPMIEACPWGDIFVTVTGCKEIITQNHFEHLKEGAILTNAGHFNVEVDVAALEKTAVKKQEDRNNIVEYTLPTGKKINLIAEGRLVNLASGDGHPAEIMDLSFALQALCAEYLTYAKLAPGLYDVPPEIDQKVARLKLNTLGIQMDSLTLSQKEYLGMF
jgi:adenosylhomocysteinase